MAESTTTLPSTAPPLPAVVPVDLRPLSTGELIDRGFALYRVHFAGLLLLALLCQSAPLLGQIAATTFRLNPTRSDLLENPQVFVWKSGTVAAIACICQVIVFCFEVVMTYYIADAYLGRLPSVKESLRRFRTRITASIWTCIVNRFLILLTFIFPVLAITALYLFAIFYPPLTWISLALLCSAGSVLVVFSVAPVLIVFMRLMVTIPALAVEDCGGWRGILRSAALVRYDPGLGIFYWGEMRLSFLLLPLFIIELLILSLTSLPLTLQQLGEIMRHGSGGQIAPPPDSVMIVSQVLTFLAGSLILPLYSIATTLFYYDIRIRREGFDLEFMAQQMEPRP